jgi:L-asparaginase II
MRQSSPYLPLFELTRGRVVESIHHGAVAVVDATGNLVAWYGDPDAVTFLRSSAKPFQAMPFIQQGGQAAYGLTEQEVALMCASHSGTDEHVTVVRGIQAKTGVTEADLLCGMHPAMHEETAEAMRQRNESPTSNRHNCSGKHTGMMSYVKMKNSRGAWDNGQEYIDPAHPLQQEILATFAEMCCLPVEKVELGIDGCSAPNFAVPLRNAALGFARLCDPAAGNVQPPERLAACHTIAAAMMAYPDMVGGPGRFDTRLMQAARGLILAKGGAEGYQAIGLMPGALGPGSPAIGIAFKIADGDGREKVRSAVSMEVLRQLGALDAAQMEALSSFGPGFPIHNWRKLVVGQGYPAFDLKRTR